MTDREKVIAKFEKEVKKTYSIKTTIYNNGKKVNEDITEHREPGIKISMEMADEILALLKEQEEMANEIIEKTYKPECEHAEHDGAGCLGYGISSQDDEPIEACKNCNKYTGNVVT